MKLTKHTSFPAAGSPAIGRGQLGATHAPGHQRIIAGPLHEVLHQTTAANSAIASATLNDRRSA